MLARLAVVCFLITVQSGLAQSPDKVTISDEVDAGKDRKTDTIVERYASGKVKVERHVAKDDQQNYVQHGPFRMYDESGQLIAEGKYDENRRTGVWNRWYQRNEIELLRQAPFSSFQAPYISQASFKNGQLDGYWIIFDARHNKISQILFKEGEREGVATWWHANGHKAQEFTYKAGAINGVAQQWNTKGTLVSREMYTDGRRLSTRTDVNRRGKTIRQGSFLEPALVLAEHDDWWEGKVAKYSPTGDSIRHGTWKTFYPSGKVASTGHFDMGAESGTFVWYHENGQKKSEGTYVDGKQTGKWRWWHNNAQPKIEGAYDQGNPTSSWVWWSDKGDVTQRAEFGNAVPVEKAEEKGIASSRRMKSEPTEELKSGPLLQVDKGPKLRSAKKEPPLLPIQ